MKILYIGHYKEGSGWSQAAIDLIKAAHSVGIEVAARNIKLTNTQHQTDPLIARLEKTPLQNIDFCIQHVLPHHFVGTQKFRKNIAYFVGESSTLKYNNWYDHLSIMDEIWVPNTTLQTVLNNDGIKNTKLVPHAHDIAKYKYNFPYLDLGSNQHKFKFYFIGDLNDRKNIESIIRCFHSEFSNNEQVALVLKVKKFGIDPASVTKHVKNMCTAIKKNLRIYSNIDSYHKEIIISEDLPEQHIYAIHNTCDCFISPSRGEGWSIPAFDAMSFGKTPICSNEGGPQMFIDENNKNTGYLVDGVYDVCNHSDPAFPTIFTGREYWFTPSEKEIKKAMRYYYEHRSSIDRTQGLNRANNFSHEAVGQIIKDILNDQQ